MNDHSQHSQHEGSPNKAPRKWIFWGFLLVAGFFLIAEHRAHVVEYLPYILLLACPLMHLFHGHGAHGHDDRDKGGADDKPNGGRS